MQEPNAQPAIAHAAPRPAEAKRPAPPAWVLAVALGLFALAMRAVYLYQLRSSPLSELLMGDAKAYNDWALRLAAGDWVGSEIFYQAPLYPYFLGVIHKLFGPGLLPVRIVQALMGAAACVMLARAGRSFFSPAAGWAAGLLLAVYPTAIFFDGLIQKSVLDTFLIASLLCVMGLIRERVEGNDDASTEPNASQAPPESSPRRRTALGWWIAAGAVLGLLMLSRENALVLVLAVAAWAALGLGRRGEGLPGEGRRGIARRVAWGLCLALGLAIILAPVAVRNKVVGGEFHLTTSQFGPNFYIGNNPAADGVYRPLRAGRGTAEFERTDAVELAQRAMGRTLSPKEVSDYWAGEAMKYIRAQPRAWVKLLGLKAMLTVNAVELGDTEDQYTYAEASSLLRVLGVVLHYGTLVPFAAAGVVLAWPRRREAWPLLFMAGAYGSSVVLFYVFARYRYPLTPFLLLFAAAALVRGWGALREKRWGALVLAGIAAIGAGVLVNWPMGPVMSVAWIRASSENNIGAYLARQFQRYDEAATHYEAALRFKPDYDEAHNNLAVALARRGDHQGALYHYARALEINPNVADVHHNLGVLLADMGRFPEAVRAHERSVQINPDNAAVRNDLGVALAATGQHEKAITQYSESLRLNPRDPAAHNGWGLSLAKLGRFDEAITHFEAALKLDPRMSRARFNLGFALMLLKRPAEAAVAFEEIVRQNPNDQAARAKLEDCRRAMQAGTEGK